MELWRERKSKNREGERERRESTSSSIHRKLGWSLRQAWVSTVVELKCLQFLVLSGGPKQGPLFPALHSPILVKTQ